MAKLYKANKRTKTPEPIQLTNLQLKAEDKFLEGIPRFDIAALFGAPLWGPAQGIWSSILFYPLWLIADNFFVYTAQHPHPLGIVLVVLALCMLVAFHVFFMRVSVPIAWHRAAERGVTKETFLKRQRIWAVVSIIFVVAVVALATYYHLVFEPVFA